MRGRRRRGPGHKALILVYRILDSFPLGSETTGTTGMKVVVSMLAVRSSPQARLRSSMEVQVGTTRTMVQVRVLSGLLAASCNHTSSKVVVVASSK